MLEDIRREGFFTTGQEIFLYDGTPLNELDQKPTTPGLPAAGGIMRPKLHKITSSEVRRLDTHVHLGITATSYRENGDAVQVTFSDRSEEAHNLVVAADGIFSQTRKLLLPGRGRAALHRVDELARCRAPPGGYGQKRVLLRPRQPRRAQPLFG